MKTRCHVLALTAALLTTGLVPSAASAQSKTDLARRLAELQVKIDGPLLADQLTTDAVQYPLANWSKRLDEAVPTAQQKEVRDALDIELKRYAAKTHKSIESELDKAAQTALVPVFSQKLSTNEMQTIIAWLESPASSKFQALGSDAGMAWAEQLIEATKKKVEENVAEFDTAAERIVSQATAKNKKP